MILKESINTEEEKNDSNKEAEKLLEINSQKNTKIYVVYCMCYMVLLWGHLSGFCAGVDMCLW